MITTMDDLFKDPVSAWEAHPMWRHWEKMLRQPEITGAKLEIYRPREGLTFRPAQIYLTFTRKDGTLLPPEKEDWDDVLNEGLIKLNVKASSREDESRRFALGLRAAFAPIDGRFGEGYFNAVLLEFIHTSPFAKYAPVPEVLSRIHRTKPDMDNRSYSDCSEMILNALRGRTQELREDLQYPDADAGDILAAAIAQYLDERFSVTNRALLGL